MIENGVQKFHKTYLASVEKKISKRAALSLLSQFLAIFHLAVSHFIFQNQFLFKLNKALVAIELFNKNLVIKTVFLLD